MIDIATARRTQRGNGSPTTTRSAGRRRGNSKGRTAWLLLSPAVIFFSLLFFLPILSQLWTSFFGGISGDEFVGFANYIKAFRDPNVATSFWITVVYTVSSLVIGTILGMLLAVILNQALPGRTIFRAILLVPYLTSIAIIGLLWRNLLDPNVGILNRILVTLHLPQQNWLTSSPLAVIVGITLWSTVGYTMVLFLAGLQSIPNEYYEAARVDGAGVWQRFWRITVPLLAPTTLFVSILGVIGYLQEFALPYIVTGGGPGNATSLYAFRVFNVAFSDGNFGYASALSFLLLIAILLLSLVQLRAGRGRGEQ